ncbi:MAG: phage tail tape measure protein [Lysinibacillus sp.]
MSRTFETTVEINGAIGSSFTNAFRSARTGMSDLREESRAVQRELDRLGTDFRNGRIHQSQYTEETRRLTRELENLESRQKRFTAFKDTVTKGWNTTKAVASIVAIGAATAAVATTFDAINVAADFEAQLSKVQSKTQGTAQEMDALRQTALELGASTSLSASETAVAMDGLAAGGMNVNSIIAAMPGIIAGAEASGEDLTLVADTVSSALSIWSLKAEEASRVSDVLAMAANVSAAGVEDMAYAFKYAGAPAAALGVQLEETAAATAIITNAGIDGSTAGTALRASLLALNNPAKAQQKIMDKLGISLYDKEGKFLSLSGVIGELDESMVGLNETEKVATISKLVGTEATSAFLSLIKAGPKELDKMTAALENSGGAAAEASKIMMDNYAGAKEQMLGAVESAKIAFATPILPVMQDAMNGIASIVENNMGAIENMGNSVAQVMADITAPFAMTEPVMPKIEPHFDPDYANAAMEKYQSDLAKYDLFQGMDTGDKVSYMLDETVAKIEEWLGGSGGEAMQRIFTEVGTIAGKAWMTAFTTTVKGAVSELMEGNFAGALAMGAAANSLSGGLLLSGGLAAGKWAVGKGRGMVGRGAGGNATSTVVPATSGSTGSRPAPNGTPVSPATTSTIGTGNRQAPNTTQVAPSRNLRIQRSAIPTPPTSDAGNGQAPSRTFRVNRSATTTPSTNIARPPSTSSRILSGIGKVASKAALPITALAGVASIFKSDNKAEAAGEAAGSVAGGLGGAKMGAAIGTVIAPGIGTAIGGALGGLAGSIGGSSIGTFVGGLFGKKEQAAVAETPPPPEPRPAPTPSPISDSAPANNATAINPSFATLNTNVTSLNSYFGTATTETQTTFTALQTETSKLTNNMSILTSYIGQASGWIVALQGIQPAAQRVVTALNNLEQRINNMKIDSNGGKEKRLAYE